MFPPPLESSFIVGNWAVCSVASNGESGCSISTGTSGNNGAELFWSSSSFINASKSKAELLFFGVSSSTGLLKLNAGILVLFSSSSTTLGCSGSLLKEELKLNAGMLVLFDTFPNSSGSSGKEGVSVWSRFKLSKGSLIDCYFLHFNQRTSTILW